MQHIVLKTYCDGLPKPTDFALEDAETPSPSEGQFLVRHIWASVDPGSRSRLSGLDSYTGAQKLGEAMGGFNVGIVEASENADWPVGTKLTCAGGWATHSLQNGRGFLAPIPPSIDLPLSYWIGVLGVPGLTGWFGLKRVGQFKHGDRVLVTSAAGPVGATAGQLAKAGGAEQVVGIAGTNEKCDWLVHEAGFDAAINYKTIADLDAAISEHFPKGIDLLFDNVGNTMVDRCLPKMRLNGRVVVSGQVADYSLAPEDRHGIQNTDVFITRRINMQGLVVFDDARDFPDALTAMANMIAKGELKLKEDRFEGLATMPEAFCGLFKGENFGRRVVKVGDE
ncbi:MAG: NADP-dependent oxidoreductase [Hyphomonadaceae bacterium]